MASGPAWRTLWHGWSAVWWECLSMAECLILRLSAFSHHSSDGLWHLSPYEQARGRIPLMNTLSALVGCFFYSLQFPMKLLNRTYSHMTEHHLTWSIVTYSIMTLCRKALEVMNIWYRQYRHRNEAEMVKMILVSFLLFTWLTIVHNIFIYQICWSNHFFK